MRNVIICAFVLLSIGAFAQKVQLGKVTADELAQRSYPDDTSATAAVLFSKGRTTFKYDRQLDGFKAVHEFWCKVKVYRKEGVALGNFEIPYFIGYKNLKPESLAVDEAVTYNLVNGKIEKSKVSSSAVLKEKVNEYWKTTTVVFPDVKIGSIIEIKYTLTSENILSFPTFKFQRDIPVEYAEYKTEIPVNYQYKVISKGLTRIKTEVATKSGSQNFDDQYGQNKTLQYTVNVSSHTASKLKALRDEDYVDNPDNYRCAVDYELELIQFPENPTHNYSQTWESLTATIYKDADFGGQLRKNDYFLNQLKLLVQEKDSQTERLNKVFAFVQERMNWNGRFGYYANDGVEKAWANQTGNVAEINLMLIAMLNLAGVETYPVLVSTVNHGVASFPNLTSFNYVIGAAIVDGKKILLDATNKMTLPGFVSIKALNWNGRLVKSYGYSEELSMFAPEVSRKSYSVICEVKSDGSVAGKMRTQFTDYAALDYRNKYSGVNKESYLQELERSFEGMQIGEYAVSNDKRSAEPVVEMFDFSSSKHAEQIGDKLYIDPLLCFTERKNPFLEDERLMPIFLGYPRNSRYNLSFKIPAGYTVESLPESINITTGANVVSFKIACQANAQNVSVSATFESKQMLVNADFYATVKDFYTKLVASESQKIVLKKT